MGCSTCWPWHPCRNPYNIFDARNAEQENVEGVQLSWNFKMMVVESALDVKLHVLQLCSYSLHVLVDSRSIHNCKNILITYTSFELNNV